MAADLSTTHFELFGLPQSFEVDTEQLDSRYRELQRTVHPDRFANASDLERRISMQQATQINEGYQTLKDPLRRGRYLLELGGYQFDDEHRTTSDAAFLMEQMELRELLSEVREAEDAFAALGKIMDRIDGDAAILVAELQRLFAEAVPGASGQIADALTKMQFFRKLQQEALELEVTLEDEIG
ncbi:MAG: Fe-S protein assembly co-chaperone HscB [Gammaproteobacteria bacterium]|jgi:molecular chaperone HscB|nr:Fe-S protein assembly co-chaperone HscB [Gammaproteobacteria bacterium]